MHFKYNAIMEVPKIPKEKGYIIRACNQAFHAVKRILPERIRESHDYDEALATVLGFIVGGYGVASAGEFLIKTANKFGANLDLESITSHCLAATLAAIPIAYGIAPDYVKALREEDPIYTSGVILVMAGASTKALEILVF